MGEGLGAGGALHPALTSNSVAHGLFRRERGTFLCPRTFVKLGRCIMDKQPTDLEFRIMPNGNGRWYWELVRKARAVLKRGVSDTQPEACQDAGDAAREAGLMN
jgi:hypothetical protein